MSRRKLNAFGQSRGERFIRLQWYLLKSETWRSLTPNDKAVLLHLWERHNGFNNGEISYAVREAEAIGISRSAAARALARLVEFGFLKVMRPSVFNMKQHEARLWAITAEKVGEGTRHQGLHALAAFLCDFANAFI